MKLSLSAVPGIAMLAAGLAFAPADAAEVKLEHKGVTLNAELELAPGKTLGGGLVIMTHGTLAHARTELMRGLQAEFRQQGINSLAINLSLGLNDRHGAYDCATPHTHRHVDALDEIGAWIGWARQQDARDIVLLGHARGGNQAAWFVAERDDPAIDTVVLLAPPVSYAAQVHERYQQRFGAPLAPALAKAKQLVSSGRGSEPIAAAGFLDCRNASVTAESFVSYYDDDRRLDTTFLLRKPKKRTLVIAGTNDTAVAVLQSRLVSMADGDQLKMVMLDGADHDFRGRYAQEIVKNLRLFRDQAFETKAEPECS